MGNTGRPCPTTDTIKWMQGGTLPTSSQVASMFWSRDQTLRYNIGEAQQRVQGHVQYLAEQRFRPRGLIPQQPSAIMPGGPLSPREEWGVTQDSVCCLTSSPLHVSIGPPNCDSCMSQPVSPVILSDKVVSGETVSQNALHWGEGKKEGPPWVEPPYSREEAGVTQEPSKSGEIAHSESAYTHLLGEK